jgi:hypothetical protein
MRMHVYQLRRRGEMVPAEERIRLVARFGDLRVKQESEWAQVYLVARLLDGGRDLLPPLQYATMASIGRGLVLDGTEERRPAHKQTWLCLKEPIPASEWAAMLAGRAEAAA